MSDEEMSIGIWLPLQPDELRCLQTVLRNSGVLVQGNYAGDDPYVVLNYLAAAAVEDCEFRSLFDRNLISPLIALAGGGRVPQSSQAEANARLAAACACFCILAKILIEPNISLYEYAADAGNDAAQSDARLFRIADNSDAIAYLDIALGRADKLPGEMLEHLSGVPEIANHRSPEKNFERALSLWKPNYLYALKAIALRRAGLAPFEAAMEFARWQTEEAFFNAPAGMYCIAAISHAPPKGGMLKGIFSENLSLLQAGIRNATWDMYLLRQFGRHVRETEGPRWSLWSTDVALREVAKALFVREGETANEKLTDFYKRHWGSRDGSRLLAAYREAEMSVGADTEARNLRVEKLLDGIDNHIRELECQLGLRTL
ncbi:MAG: hypothetical protein ACK41V_14760 [Acidovorax sp.]|uniref:hypothetical protein n=1 Tax=Acidovorax sp. TaxID=1872122 RepID=UPI00391D4F27